MKESAPARQQHYFTIVSSSPRLALKLRRMAVPCGVAIHSSGTWNGRGNSYLHQVHMPLIFPAGILVDIEMIS